MRAWRYIVVAILLVAVGEATAQRMPERGLVRRGNRQFKREHFEKSTDLYQRALQHDSTSFEAKYDLASAMYRTERYDSAEQLLRSIVQDTTRTERERGEVAYNLGNTQFAQQKYKEALSSYRYAMRCNPDDKDAKFNYAFTKRLVQQQEQQEQQQNQDNKEQNQDKQDQQGQQDKNEQDKQQQEQQQEQQQPQNQEEKEGEGQQQPREGAMSPEQQEAMLQAIQAEEDKTQEKLKEKAGVIIRGSKSW